MNFEQGWYVPAMRWKQGEKEALSWLRDSTKSRITPLVELILKNFKNTEGKRLNPQKAINKFVEELDQYWGDRPVFIDFHNIVESGIKSHKNQPHLVEMLSMAATHSRPLIPSYFSIIPVTRLTRAPEFQSAIESVVKTNRSGVCLRITTEEIFARSFVSDVQSIISKFGLEAKECDLVIDTAYATDTKPLQEILDGIPQLPNWRSLAFLSGSFPKDLQDYEKDNVHKIIRSEWFYFREQTQLLSKACVCPCSETTPFNMPFIQNRPTTAIQVRAFDMLTRIVG